jgi:hypothetical protein
MQAIGVLLLAAATVGDGFGYDDAGVHMKKWLRPHAVVHGGAPGPPPYTAASLAGGGGGGMAGPGRRFATSVSQIYFLDPNGMLIGWQSGMGPQGEKSYLAGQLTAPARYNFRQGYIYRLKLTSIPGRPTATLYPTIEVAPTTPLTDAYLAHNAIPVQFTPEDFDQVVDGGNFVTKVIYLPDPRYQELAIAGVETLVSTRLEPGVDPILEADRRGTILLIVRLGAIDLENPGPPPVPVPVGAPAVIGGPPVVGAPTELPPGALPPGAAVPAPAAPGVITLDAQPTTVVPAAPVQVNPPAAAPGAAAPGAPPATPRPAPELVPAVPGAAPAAPPAPGAPAPAPAVEPAKPKTASYAPSVVAPEASAAPGS